CEAAPADEAEHAVSLLPREHRLAAGDHRPRDLEPGHVLRRTGWGRVEARTLDEIGGIDPGEPDLDEDLVVARPRVGPLLQPHHLAAAGARVDDRPHDASACTGRRSTVAEDTAETASNTAAPTSGTVGPPKAENIQPPIAVAPA